MEPRIIKDSIKKSELKEIAQAQFGDFVKAVVDVRQEIMALGGELHADLEVLLNEQEHTKRENAWGINLYPEETEGAFVEFNSMINIKPALGNRSRGVEDLETREKIKAIVAKLVVK